MDRGIFDRDGEVGSGEESESGRSRAHFCCECCTSKGWIIPTALPSLCKYDPGEHPGEFIIITSE